jgi:hypothetical protein
VVEGAIALQARYVYIGSGLRIGQVALLAQLRRHGPLSTSQLAELLAIECRDDSAARR